MKLKKVILHNYRCYTNDVSVSIDNLTCIIGRNDVGKSSIKDGRGTGSWHEKLSVTLFQLIA